jgi:hypothetical protein
MRDPSASRKITAIINEMMELSSCAPGIIIDPAHPQEGAVDDPIVFRFDEAPPPHPDDERLSMSLADEDDTPPRLPELDALRRSARVAAQLRASSAQLGTIPQLNSSYTESIETMNLAVQAMRAYAAKVTTKAALRSADHEEWLRAIRDEIHQLLATGTLEAETPQGSRGVDYQLIHSTMQLKLKLTDDGSIDKYKARCCARGDMLRGLIAETYSPTIGNLAHAVAHQLSIMDGFHECIVDTTGAYLYEEYPKDAQPLYLMLEKAVAEALGLDPSVKYRVKKYLYGLPDSGRAYYEGYSTHLQANGYTRTVSDPCLFTKITAEHRTYLWTHVDDTFVTSSDPAEITEFQRVLGLKYQFSVNTAVDSYLGIHLTRQGDGGVMLTQPKLLAEVFEEFKPWDLPGTTRVTAPRRDHAEDDWDTTLIPRNTYLHLLGALLYLTKSRPDIATAVSFASVHSQTPTQGAYNELLRCVQYLWNTREKGLILHKGSPRADLRLNCFVDASYLTHADSKSHTGYCMSFGEIGTFYSRSTKQGLVTTSSTHAEARALYQLILDVIYVVNLCNELGRPVSLPAVIFEDNQPVIDISTGFTRRAKHSKHFVMLINFIREQVETGLISLAKVDTLDNIADILTKIVMGSAYSEKAEQLLGTLRLHPSLLTP